MDLRSILLLGISFTVFAAANIINNNAGRRVILRPLTAREVVRVLKLAGREDAIPEGRVVTQGLAAITGFALGLTKGIGGSLLFDLATSNATSEFINNFNATAVMGDFQGIDMTALMQMFKLDTVNSPNAIKYKTTEICFDTRIEDPVIEEMGRQAGESTDIATDTDNGTGAPIDTEINTDTNTNTITQPATSGDQTCIVLQKPIFRKRRSLHRKRKR